MRTLSRAFGLALSGVLIAAPSWAQPLPAGAALAYIQQRDAELAAEAQAARNRDIALRNELMSLEARLRADQAAASLSTLRVAPAPVIAFDPKHPPKPIDPKMWAQIPDATLAASNARAIAASENRR